MAPVTSPRGKSAVLRGPTHRGGNISSAHSEVESRRVYSDYGFASSLPAAYDNLYYQRGEQPFLPSSLVARFTLELAMGPTSTKELGRQRIQFCFISFLHFRSNMIDLVLTWMKDLSGVR